MLQYYKSCSLLGDKNGDGKHIAIRSPVVSSLSSPSAAPSLICLVPCGREHLDDIDENELFERIRDAIRDENDHVYMCLENFLPDELYKACVAHWPLSE